MKSELFKIFKSVYPELSNYEEPDDPSDFDAVFEWLNSKVSNVQQINLMDYQDNGIDDCYQFKVNSVNIEKLKDKIDASMKEDYQDFDEGDEEQDFDHMYSYDEQFTFNAFFNNIRDAADLIDQSLLVIQTENPYWLLIPNDEEKIEQVLTVFNDIYDEEMPMIAY